MTVQELITELQKIEDKSLNVKIAQMPYQTDECYPAEIEEVEIAEESSEMIVYLWG